jgi:hypothetical protein
MRKGILAVSSLFLALSLAGCAHQSGGYGYGGGGYLDDCEYAGDCYGGPQYTCVFYEWPAPAPARMEINVARHFHSTRVVGPREGGSSQDYGPGSSSSSSSSASAPPASMPIVAREPVVMAAPSVDRGTPRAHN